tara:strand:- start:492 stop:1724 length:1233 start_codon:yes stop_codon:yes gene_type:complete
MKKNINNIFALYTSILLVFGIFFLYEKHMTGNDSTISEWLINYSGGFTKRGIIGQISIYMSNFLDIGLRKSILILQVSIFTIYSISIFLFFKNIKKNNFFILAIFSPIFLLYPIAEIEVLARKEIFIFCLYLLFLKIKNPVNDIAYKLTLIPLGILIWEPMIFFLPFWLVVDIFNSENKKINYLFLKKLIFYIPALLLALYIAINPITEESHSNMANYLKINFGEICYMSCGLLLSKASIYKQFAYNFSIYNFEVLFRYSLILIIGFTPLMLLAKSSTIVTKNILFLRNFKNLFYPMLIMLSPVIILFAMGYDWGRWVNISYVFSILFYFNLYKKKFIKLDISKINIRASYFVNKKGLFIFIFIIYCFGWNPKTVITGDVASFPGYRIPYKAFKIISQKYIKPNFNNIKN